MVNHAQFPADDHCVDAISSFAVSTVCEQSSVCAIHARANDRIIILFSISVISEHSEG